MDKPHIEKFTSNYCVPGDSIISTISRSHFEKIIKG
jgi:hypothetical protein